MARTASGRVVAARISDGKSAGLFEVDERSGDVSRVGAPPATIVALAAVGERVVAATPQGIFASDGPGQPFRLVRAGAATALLAVPAGVSAPALLLAATPDGVVSSRDGTAWQPAGLSGNVEALSVVLVEGAAAPTVTARSGGRTLFWGGSGWSASGGPVQDGRKLAGGFGKPRTAAPAFASVPVGLEVRREASGEVLSFRGADAPGVELLVVPPEPGLPVAAWAGDPRRPDGLWLATLGRGLFRFVPGT